MLLGQLLVDDGRLLQVVEGLMVVVGSLLQDAEGLVDVVGRLLLVVEGFGPPSFENVVIGWRGSSRFFDVD